MTRMLQLRMSLPVCASGFLLGAGFLQLFPILPSPYWLALLLPGLFILLVLHRPFIACGLIGFSWALLHAIAYTDHVLPQEIAGQDVWIEGRVDDIPSLDGKVQRFYMTVESLNVNSSSQAKYIRLSWYRGQHLVNAGERWRLLVRLKPPHGFMNPGGFDYEKWLFQKGVHATGYVRENPQNERLAETSSLDMDHWRQQIKQHLLTIDNRFTPLLIALAVGDKAEMASADWQLLTRTGTNHLLAISGLHIGLVAGFAFWLTRRYLPVFIIKRIPGNKVAAILGLFAAAFYATLAGFAIPTQRAMIMLFVVLGGILLSRNIRPANSLSMALIAVLIIDPLSVLSVGFWFSFLAVAVIAYGFAGRITRGLIIAQWWRLQWIIALALFPASLFLFQQASMIAPLANLILVPWVSFLVVPFVLLGLLIYSISPELSYYLFNLANEMLSLIWPVLSYLDDLPLSSWQHTSPSWLHLSLACVGIGLLLAPKGFPLRLLGILLLLPVVLVRAESLEPGDMKMTLLDVGQGLAVFVKTQQHALLFDTGAKFSERFDVGERVILPFLISQSVNRLDKLIISHGDNDHIGGAQSVIDGVDVEQVVGQDIQNLNHQNKNKCIAGHVWHWDGIEFEFLHPDQAYDRRNNRGCVLMIRHKAGRVLIAADVEKKVEKRLVSEYGDQLKADVLIVPHHGSKTSSTVPFIERVQPKYALVSAGYMSRFKHPADLVVERYQKIGAKVINTAGKGAIRFEFSQLSGLSSPYFYRDEQRHYWNHSP